MNDVTDRKPYRQLFANENDEFFKAFIKDPLLWAVFTVCAIRARRSITPSPEGLEQGEFFISQMEYAKFGLKKSQKGKLARIINKLLFLKYMSKTGRKIGNEQSNVYRLESRHLIDINIETGNETGNAQVTSRYRIGSNKNDKNDKKLAAGNASSLKTKQQAWDNFSNPYLESLNISDPVFIKLARQAYFDKAKAVSEKTVQAFINMQKQITPPDMAEYRTELWPEVLNG